MDRRHEGGRRRRCPGHVVRSLDRLRAQRNLCGQAGQRRRLELRGGSPLADRPVPAGGLLQRLVLPAPRVPDDGRLDDHAGAQPAAQRSDDHLAAAGRRPAQPAGWRSDPERLRSPGGLPAGRHPRSSRVGAGQRVVPGSGLLRLLLGRRRPVRALAERSTSVRSAPAIQRGRDRVLQRLQRRPRAVAHRLGDLRRRRGGQPDARRPGRRAMNDSRPAMSETLASKVPQVTLAFWVIKLLATTVGETGGDALSMTLNLGYATASLIYLTFFAATLAAQVSARRYHPAIYWAVVVATTTVGTTVSDYLDRTVGLGYVKSSIALLAAVVVILLVWRAARGRVQFEGITDRRDEIFYWLAIVVANTLGTALGDCTADDLGLGFSGGALVFAGLLAVVAALYRWAPRLPRSAL